MTLIPELLPLICSGTHQKSNSTVQYHLQLHHSVRSAAVRLLIRNRYTGQVLMWKIFQEEPSALGSMWQ